MLNIKSIEDRRSTRKFHDISIKEGDIKKILAAMRYAPSPKNLQPWSVHIMSNTERHQVAELMRLHSDDDAGIIESSRILDSMRNAIAVFIPDKYKDNTSALLSIGAAIQNVLLVATRNKYGTLWIRDHYKVTEQAQDVILGNCKECPEDLYLVSIICIGFSDDHSKRAKKKELDEFLI